MQLKQLNSITVIGGSVNRTHNIVLWARRVLKFFVQRAGGGRAKQKSGISLKSCFTCMFGLDVWKEKSSLFLVFFFQLQRRTLRQRGYVICSKSYKKLVVELELASQSSGSCAPVLFPTHLGGTIITLEETLLSSRVLKKLTMAGLTIWVGSFKQPCPP